MLYCDMLTTVNLALFHDIPIRFENSGSYRREKTSKLKPDQYKLLKKMRNPITVFFLFVFCTSTACQFSSSEEDKVFSETNNVHSAVAPMKQFENALGDSSNGWPIVTADANQLVETVSQDEAGAGLQKSPTQKRIKTAEEREDHTIRPNGPDKVVKMGSNDGLTGGYACSYDQDSQESLITNFTNTQDYQKRLDIFNNFIRTNDKVRSVSCLLINSEQNEFKRQLLYFMDDMKKSNPDNLSGEEHIAVLYNVLKDRSLPGSLMSLIFDQFFSYISDISNENINLYFKFFLSTESSDNLPVEFRIFFIKEVLKQNICEKPVIQSSLMVIKDDRLDLQTRDEILELFFAACDTKEDFEDAVTALAVESDLEWALKIKAVQLSNDALSTGCFDTIVHHLLSFFSREIRWHIRDAAVWGFG